MSLPTHRMRLLAFALLGSLLFSSCGDHITFEKVDLRGHVRVVGPNKDEGYCFRVPSAWEIRENLEGADVVCLAPPSKGTFRESILARAVSAEELKDPEALLKAELEKMGEKVEVVEPWQDDLPMLVNVLDTKFSSLPLSQLLFLHRRPDGSGVLICCTTRREDMAARRADFEKILEKAKFELVDCPGKGGIPETFPTPEVTFSPASSR